MIEYDEHIIENGGIRIRISPFDLFYYIHLEVLFNDEWLLEATFHTDPMSKYGLEDWLQLLHAAKEHIGKDQLQETS